MALNLVRNSRIFFTTNVNSSTGVINSSGFTTLNTQEIQVLDGFTFSQNTNSETITLSEAGGDPIRGQRAFNTSLAPVDFSFSTYVRPSNASSYITAEEAGLWNALLSANDTTKYDITSVTVNTGVSYAASTGVVTIAGTSLGGVVVTGSAADSTKINVNDIITLTGLTTGTTSDAKYINAACKVTAIAAGSITATLLNPPPSMASISTISNSATTISVYKSAWAPVTSTYSTVTAATSNKNQLQKFGMIFVVDNVTNAVDNCAMNQVTIDFGLDSIATLAWAGQATALRDASSTISLTGSGSVLITNATVTNLPSTDNIFVGNVVQYTGSGGLTSQTGNSVTIATVTGTTSLTLTGGTLTTTGYTSSFKVLNYSATATIGTVVGSASPWTAPLTGLTSTQGISVGDAITATTGAGTWGTGTAVVKSVDSSSAITVTFTGGAAPVAGGVTAVYVTIATLGVPALTAAAKITSAPFITNKLSTVTFKTLNALGSASAATYAIALTGGSVTITNNISYVTPSNLGIVNIPTTYYTGTRAISGTMNAYLKTGSGVGSTGQLLADMLAAASASTEPMASLSIALGGSTAATRVELDMPAVTFSIPAIDVQQVISTNIKFTAEGSLPSATANGNTFAVDAVNDLTVRYYSA